jgi:hypothetical protein
MMHLLRHPAARWLAVSLLLAAGIVLMRAGFTAPGASPLGRESEPFVLRRSGLAIAGYFVLVAAGIVALMLFGRRRDQKVS